jgi:hypothetical protein
MPNSCGNKTVFESEIPNLKVNHVHLLRTGLQSLLFNGREIFVRHATTLKKLTKLQSKNNFGTFGIVQIFPLSSAQVKARMQ